MMLHAFKMSNELFSCKRSYDVYTLCDHSSDGPRVWHHSNLPPVTPGLRYCSTP